MANPKPAIDSSERCLPLFVLLLALFAFGCEKEPPKVEANAVKTKPSEETRQSLEGGLPTAAHEASADGLNGEVLETMDASTYTYVKLATAAGEIWAAGPRANVSVGERLSLINPNLMTDFKSNTLDRTFPEIYFADAIVSSQTKGEDNAPHGPGGAMPHSGGKPLIDPAELKQIEALEGGHRVEEIYAQRESLAGKEVSLRAQVVKTNLNIMGRNWIHLQDGSGDANAGTFDLTVTSTQEVAVGALVIARGKLAVERDFGHGYAYPVLLEEASFEVQ